MMVTGEQLVPESTITAWGKMRMLPEIYGPYNDVLSRSGLGGK